MSRMIYFDPAEHGLSSMSQTAEAETDFALWENLCADGLRDPDAPRGHPGHMTGAAFAKSRACLAASRTVEVDLAMTYFASRPDMAEGTAAEHARAASEKYGLAWDLSPGAMILAALQAGARVDCEDGRGFGPQTEVVFGPFAARLRNRNNAYVDARRRGEAA
jgi:hypothetical protein